MVGEIEGCEPPTRSPPTITCGTTCGKDRMNKKRGHKIVGGTNAASGEIGWQVRTAGACLKYHKYFFISKFRFCYCLNLFVEARSSMTNGFWVPHTASMTLMVFSLRKFWKCSTIKVNLNTSQTILLQEHVHQCLYWGVKHQQLTGWQYICYSSINVRVSQKCTLT